MNPRTSTMSYRHTATLTFSAVVLVCCQSCVMPPSAPPIPPTVSGFQAPGADLTSLRRVVVFPSRATKAEEAKVFSDFAEALAIELRGTGTFEVIKLDQRTCQRLQNSVIEGAYHEQILVDMANNYRADAVLFVGVNDYHAYYPPRMSVTAHLVSTNLSTNLASIHGTWDASRATTASLAKHYAQSQSHKWKVPRGDLVLQSPRIYQQFVANQVVLGMMESCQQSGSLQAEFSAEVPRPATAPTIVNESPAEFVPAVRQTRAKSLSPVRPRPLRR